MNDLKITLYEFLGYIFPGFLFCFSLYLVAMHFYNFRIMLQLLTINVNSNIFLFFTIFTSYLFGHVVQAISNSIVFLTPERKTIFFSNKEKNECIHPKLIELVKTTQLIKSFSLKDEDFENCITDIAIRFVKISKFSSQDDIYSYREGLYRGLCISSLSIFISSTLCIITNDIVIFINNTNIELNRFTFLSISIFSFMSFILFRNRYIRFTAIRTQHALYSLIFNEFLDTHISKVIIPS